MEKPKYPAKTFFVGESVEVITTIDQNTVDSATYAVKDISGLVLASGNMTFVTNKVYSFIYDSPSTINPQKLNITMWFVLNGHTTIYQDRFILESTVNNEIINEERFWW